MRDGLSASYCPWPQGGPLIGAVIELWRGLLGMLSDGIDHFLGSKVKISKCWNTSRQVDRIATGDPSIRSNDTEKPIDPTIVWIQQMDRETHENS